MCHVKPNWTKREGIALGTLIPFGIGVAVGASFNYFTMERFSKTTLKYVTLKCNKFPLT